MVLLVATFVFQIQSFIIILDVLHCSPLYPLSEVILYAVVCALLLYIQVTYNYIKLMICFTVNDTVFWNFIHYNYYYCIFSIKRVAVNEL